MLEVNENRSGFFSDLINDAPIFNVIDLVIKEYEQGNKIVFLTGRPERYRYSTTLWLKGFFKFEINLLMRNLIILWVIFQKLETIFQKNLYLMNKRILPLLQWTLLKSIKNLKPW